MKKIAMFLLFVFGAVSAFAISAADASSLLQKTQANTEFFETDFIGTYSIVQEKPGDGTNASEATIYRRDKTSQWTILVTNPTKDKGRGYLLQDGTIWLYDPADGRYTFTSSKDKFQNTNANTSDFAPQAYHKNYDIVSAAETTLGKLECVVFELKAKDKVKNVDYPQLKIWVTAADGLVRKKEDYSLSGQLLRTTAIPAYQSMTHNGRNYSVPTKMLIVDNLRGKKIGNSVQYERTQITITNVSFKKVDDIVYTKPYLEMMAQK